MKWVQLCSSLNILWQCPYLGLEWRLIRMKSGCLRITICIFIIMYFSLILKVSHKYKCEAARANTMTGSPDLSFGFPWNGGIPHPHQAAWSRPINRHSKVNKENMRESGKARECLSLNKSPWNVVPIKFLYKHVTNALKPATNCLCSPYKFM